MSKMRVAKLDNGRWVVEFDSEDLGWYSFDDQDTYATRKEAEREMREFQMQNAQDAAAERKYQNQIAYACGERE